MIANVRNRVIGIVVLTFAAFFFIRGVLSVHCKLLPQAMCLLPHKSVIHLQAVLPVVQALVLEQEPAEGGGGGGGGGAVTSNTGLPTTVNFSGMGYPSSKVVILQDGVSVITTTCDPNANFSASLTGPDTRIIYIFTLYY